MENLGLRSWVTARLLRYLNCCLSLTIQVLLIQEIVIFGSMPSKLLGRTIQIEGRADHGKVAKGLRGVSQLLAAPRDLLREHGQVVGEAQHVLE